MKVFHTLSHFGVLHPGIPRAMFICRKALCEDNKLTQWEFHNALTFFRFITGYSSTMHNESNNVQQFSHCFPPKCANRIHSQWDYIGLMNRFWCPLFVDWLDKNNMNCFLRLRTRSQINVTISKCQGQNESQTSKLNSSEKQIYILLLLVSFAFLILTTPAMLWYYMKYTI